MIRGDTADFFSYFFLDCTRCTHHEFFFLLIFDAPAQNSRFFTYFTRNRKKITNFTWNKKSLDLHFERNIRRTSLETKKSSQRKKPWNFYEKRKISRAPHETKNRHNCTLTHKKRLQNFTRNRKISGASLETEKKFTFVLKKKNENQLTGNISPTTNTIATHETISA